MATAALGHGTAGPGEVKASRPYWPTLRASVEITESSARGRKGWKGLEQHGHACARRRRSWRPGGAAPAVRAT